VERTTVRVDLGAVAQWIKPQARVLDLGCGDGGLLASLREQLQVIGYGLEIDESKINLCIEKGVNVIEQDLDLGLKNFVTNSFDTVVMTQTLQAVRYPHLILEEMLRIGRECIVTFPNFGHWRCRWYLGLRGRMPVSEFMPYQWYDTPNIHFCTIRDFEALCDERRIRILNRRYVDAAQQEGLASEWLPNLFAVTAIYHISK